MLVVEEQLATADRSNAYQIGDVLLVRLAGTKPTACHIVTIERSLPDVEPPAFVARLSMDIRAKCRPESAPFEVHQAFRVGLRRDTVVVHHSAGALEVTVDDLTPPPDSAEEPTLPARGPGVTLINVGGQPGEAVGYSRSYDLKEAIEDAITQLPPQGPGIPDWLSSYVVTSIGVEKGGIGGFDHLKVRVSG